MKGQCNTAMQFIYCVYFVCIFFPSLFCCFRWCAGSFIQYTQLLADHLQDQVRLEKKSTAKHSNKFSFNTCSCQNNMLLFTEKKVWIQDEEVFNKSLKSFSKYPHHVIKASKNSLIVVTGMISLTG